MNLFKTIALAVSLIALANPIQVSADWTTKLAVTGVALVAGIYWFSNEIENMVSNVSRACLINKYVVQGMTRRNAERFASQVIRKMEKSQMSLESAEQMVKLGQ